MPATLLLTLLLTHAAPASPAKPARAATYAAAGETHLRRATGSPPHLLDELQSAHDGFDSAYLVDGGTVYLCRALAVADLALRTATFSDEQERISWEETRLDDLDRLQQDAATTGRPNCRFDASGQPSRPRVALLADSEPSPLQATPTPPPPPLPRVDKEPPPGPTTAQKRRTRTHTIAGAVVTSAGIGLLGGLAGVIAVEHQRLTEMRRLINLAEAENRNLDSAESTRFNEISADLLRGRGVAIGVGVASVVTLTTGVALLATRKQPRTRSYALYPYGGLQGAGAVLRLRF